MSDIQKGIEWIKQIATDDSHGYSQINRNGPDYDCSSLVNKALREAGFAIEATWTGNMLSDLTKHGFVQVKDVNLATGNGLLPGDVLLYHNNSSNSGHTAMYIGDGKIVEATSDEVGGINGSKQGDQTGHEIHIRNYYNFPWMYVLRSVDVEKPDVYIVQKNDTLWGIANKFNMSLSELASLNNISINDYIYPGQQLLINGEIIDIPKLRIEAKIINHNIKNVKLENGVIVIEMSD